MSEFKGTSGKWEISKEGDKLETSINTKKYRICEVKHYDSQIDIKLLEPEFLEGKANALLISKSPLLLEAIRDSINKLREYGLDNMADYHEKIYNECVNL